MNHPLLTTAALTTALILSAAPFGAAQAGEHWSGRAAQALGQYIAVQGNQALQQIRADLSQDLGDKLKPVLPSRSEIKLTENAGSSAPDSAALAAK